MPDPSGAAWSRDRLQRMLGLAIPIIGGMLSQNLLNLVDTAMVGTLGDAALAAVGLASFTNFMCIAILTGVSAGVQATAARLLGAGRTTETARPLNAGLVWVLACGLPASLLLIALVPLGFPLLGDDPEVVALGTTYLQARLAGMVAIGMNFAFRGYWSAINRAGYYVRTMVLMHVTNIALNWVLIFGHLGAPALGTLGAGIGTTVSLWLGTASHLVLGLRHARSAGFLSRAPDRTAVTAVLRVAVPAGVQQLFFAMGMTAFFWILGQLGTADLAAGNVLVTLTLLWILPATGFGLAAASLVGQTLGAGDPRAARVWAWQVAAVAAGVVGAVALPAAVAPDVFLGLFIHDPATLALARGPLRLIALLMAPEAAGIVLMNAHYGAGQGRRVMVINLGLHWGLFLPVAYLLGPILGHGLFVVWCANAAYRTLQAGFFAASWARGRWAVEAPAGAGA